MKNSKPSTEIDGKRLHTMLNGIDVVIYVADPDTYDILYMNEIALNTWGRDSIGQKCYRVLQGREQPCPFCTNDKIFGEYKGRSYVWEFQNETNRHWYPCYDQAIWLKSEPDAGTTFYFTLPKQEELHECKTVT